MQIPPRREGDALVVSRSFPVGPGRVWAALTENSELSRWYGHWSGDPASGTVDVTMTAEEGAPSEPMRIDACEPQRLLALSSVHGDVRLEIEVRLTEGPEATVVELAQRILSPREMGEYMPGWEFYLDRLGASLAGSDVEAINFEDYFPSRAQKYVDLAS